MPTNVERHWKSPHPGSTSQRAPSCHSVPWPPCLQPTYEGGGGRCIAGAIMAWLGRLRQKAQSTSFWTSELCELQEPGTGNHRQPPLQCGCYWFSSIPSSPSSARPRPERPLCVPDQWQGRGRIRDYRHCRCSFFCMRCSGGGRSSLGVAAFDNWEKVEKRIMSRKNNRRRRKRRKLFQGWLYTLKS